MPDTIRVLIATAVASAGLVLLPAPTADADVFGEFYNAIDWLGDKYDVFVYVSSAPMEHGVYAETVGDTITLNSEYNANPDSFHADVASDMSTGYHRAAKCSAPAAIAAHEFAHVLDYLTNFTTRAELLAALNSGFGGTVSAYALKSPGEAIAESFAAVECDVPTPAEQAIYTMLVN